MRLGLRMRRMRLVTSLFLREGMLVATVGAGVRGPARFPLEVGEGRGDA